MGCHIYIKTKEGRENVSCPWYRVAPSYGKKILTKADFRAFLEYNKAQDDKFIAEAEALLVRAKNSELEAITDISVRYHNNLGYMQERDKNGVESAVIHIQTFEVERLKRFAMTQSKIDEFLEAFDEDNHIVQLG